MIINVKYQELEQMSLQLPVYVGSNTITLYDDGTHNDSVAGDSIYTGILNENIQDFQNTINNLQQTINRQPYLLSFTGHLGASIPTNVRFDMNSFSGFLSVPIDPIFISPAGRATSAGCTIIKQNSLFITDTLVVEDVNRTYNQLTNHGNRVGNWTFGTLIKNMAGSGPTPKDLLHSWLRNFVVDIPVNGQLIKHRPNVLSLFIAPWLVKASGAPSIASVTLANWDSLWNAANQDSLLQRAPFKLTAIVNRLDLRGNSGYSGGVSNSGETRFIFTLIDPHAGDGPYPLGVNGLTSGRPPLQIGSEFGTSTDFYDWRGMNVIFEYGNTENNLCDVINFAKQWVKLSTMTVGTTAYLDSLDAITSTVTSAGAGAATGKPNGSAINRIRTNERIFDTSSPTSVPAWVLSDWEFRQFELQPGSGSSLFMQVPLTNTPRNSANSINNTGGDINTSGPIPTIPFNTVDQDNLMNWAFSSPAVITNIMHGNQSIPDSFGGIPLLSGGARVDFEYLHYLDLNWHSTAPNYVAYAATHPVPNTASYKQFRQQLSLGTCQGCHNGETKTIFTEIAPLGYGQTANYWNSFPTPPDFVAGQIDTRFVSKATSSIYPAPPNPENVVRVSAFLTGRNFRMPGGLPGYFDDSVSTAEDATDRTLTGLFYVNAPDNYPSNVINIPNKKFGYNDLERRSQDLCTLSNSSCSTLSTLALFSILIGVPLPFGGH